MNFLQLREEKYPICNLSVDVIKDRLLKIASAMSADQWHVGDSDCYLRSDAELLMSIDKPIREKIGKFLKRDGYLRLTPLQHFDKQGFRISVIGSDANNMRFEVEYKSRPLC